MSTSKVALAQLKSAVVGYTAIISAFLARMGSGQLSPENIQAQLDAATKDAIQQVMHNIEGFDIDQLTTRFNLQRKMVEIENAFDPQNKFAFELFAPLYTIADTLTITGAKTVAGDDSVDVSSTVGLKVAREYVVEGTGGGKQTVVVHSILSATRFKAQAVSTVTITGGTLRRTNWTIGSGDSATDGQVYYSVPLNLDATVVQDKAIVVRKSAATADPLLYFKDNYHPTWTEAKWEWKRTTKAGFEDIEFRVPARGQLELKLVAVGASIFEHLVAVSRDANLKGTHRVPDSPVNAFPLSNATDIGERPTLQILGYSHQAGTNQGGIQFQVSKNGSTWDGAMLAYDSGMLSASLGLAVPAGILQANLANYWFRARVSDIAGGVSEWSAATKFTTKASFESHAVTTPTNVTPANNATDLSPTPPLSCSHLRQRAERQRIPQRNGKWGLTLHSRPLFSTPARTPRTS